MQIKSPEDLRKFVDTIIAQFESRQQQDAADKLHRIQDTAFGTSSEWLGELGLAIRSIQKETHVEPDIRQDFQEILQTVKRAWPRL